MNYELPTTIYPNRLSIPHSQKVLEIRSITLFLCAFCAFLRLKNLFNQRNPRLINHLFSPGNELRRVVLNLGNLDFDIVSDFDIRISYFAGIGIFTTVEKPLQISSFLTNKANFLDDQMNVNKVLTKDYENKSNWTLGENKPNTKPIKANFRKAKMNVTSFLTKDYENKSNWALCENKANTKPNKPNPPAPKPRRFGWAEVN